jgi:hypothetical protein
VTAALGCGQLETGTGLNQEQCLQRPGDTRWSSHYKTFKSLLNMFPTIVEVLKVIEKDDRDWKIRDQASNLIVYFKSFDFAFLFASHVDYINRHKCLIISIAKEGSRHC